MIDCLYIFYVFKFSKFFIIFIKQFLDDDNYFLFEGFNIRSWHFIISMCFNDKCNHKYAWSQGAHLYGKFTFYSSVRAFSKPFLYIILTFLNYLNLLDKD